MRGEKATETEEKTVVDAKETTKSKDTKAAKTTTSKAAKTAAEEKGATEKKASKTQKKPAAKEQVKPDIFIQFQSKETNLEDALEQVKQQYVSAGHRVSSIKSLQVYLKPEENAAYYVINQKFAGKVNLF